MDVCLIQIHNHADIDIFQVSEKKFRKRVWPVLRTALAVGWKNCDPEQLYLLLVCENKFPVSVSTDGVDY